MAESPSISMKKAPADAMLVTFFLKDEVKDWAIVDEVDNEVEEREKGPLSRLRSDGAFMENGLLKERRSGPEEEVIDGATAEDADNEEEEWEMGVLSRLRSDGAFMENASSSSEGGRVRARCRHQAIRVKMSESSRCYKTHPSKRKSSTEASSGYKGGSMVTGLSEVELKTEMVSALLKESPAICLNSKAHRYHSPPTESTELSPAFREPVALPGFR
ncbi:uncharacterized protein EI90DRAFT_3130740 [Cantharellus anzutake]|uniref:uncharacterized protein n=1 Tax=Cantharellus anzutake TaxID=1750568 RepID=UPI0019068C99|nr:uncharacterized protein EI90DRAFT_3130740 [Cantharellus anzutake]KAF8322835.1 hypothetical protein EI90DRAFT_3130740 [Cantharellus anzutake]